MEEELYESDVIWQDNKASPVGVNKDAPQQTTAPPPPRHARSRSSSAAPMDIPSARRARGGGEKGYEEEAAEGWAPPHVVASRRRRMEGKVAFSLSSGQGRTLKGRDLSHVRNSVLRMTGFLEG